MLINNKKVKEIENKIKNDVKLKRTEIIHYRNMNIRKSNINYVYNHIELLEIVRCYDIEYFIKKYIDIKLFDHQKKIIKLFQDNRFSIILKSRQTGVDTILMILFLHYMLFNNDKTILLKSIKSMLGIEKIKIFKKYYKELPFFLQKGVVSWNKTSVELDNGCKITTNFYFGYSTTINILHIDEYSKFKSIHFQKLKNLIPSVTSIKDSKIIISSIPNGYNNNFHDMVINSERSENDPLKNNYKTLRVHWKDVPNRNEKWKNEQIKMIGENFFNQEYELKFIK